MCNGLGDLFLVAKILTKLTKAKIVKPPFVLVSKIKNTTQTTEIETRSSKYAKEMKSIKEYQVLFNKPVAQRRPGRSTPNVKY